MNPDMTLFRTLQRKMDDSDTLLASLRRSLAEVEDNFTQETRRLRKALEEEEFSRNQLHQRIVVLEDELKVKQTEVGS